MFSNEMIVWILSSIIIFLVVNLRSADSVSKEFCETKQFKSVFNINQSVYFMTSDNIFWKFDSKSNNINVDEEMKSIVSKINFDVNHPVLGFKFDEILECSKDPIKCKDNDYIFDGIGHCNTTADKNKGLAYCRDAVKMKDIIVLIGSDSMSKQFYQALKYESGVYQILDKMPHNLKGKSHLSDKTFIKIQSSDEQLVSIFYFVWKSIYELVIIVKAKDTLKLRTSSFDNLWSFDHWKEINTDNSLLKQSIGLFKTESVGFAVDPNGYTLYSYEVYGPQNSMRKFEPKKNLKSLLNCVGDDNRETVTQTVAQTVSQTATQTHSPYDPMSEWTTVGHIVTTPNNTESGIPLTGIWLLITIPIIAFFVIIVTIIILYFWFHKSKSSSKSVATAN